MQQAFIFDLDGTLADVHHRLYCVKDAKKDRKRFFDLCDQDEPIQSTIDVLNNLAKNYYIIILSGRSDAVEKKTKEWLVTHGVQYHKLIMRKANTFTPDNELKKIMYEKHIKGKFDVLGIFDDRKRVVDMRRSM